MQQQDHSDAEQDAPGHHHQKSGETAIRKAEKEENSRWSKTKEYWAKGESWLAVGTFLVLIIYTALTYGLWREQIQANEINSEIMAAAESSQVYFGRLLLGGMPQPDNSFKENVMVEIGNSGGSITRGLKLRSACKPSESTITDPFDRTALASAQVQRLVLAPKQPPETPIVCSLSTSELALANVARLFLYVFGTATYEDTIRRGEIHRLEFCLALKDFSVGGGMIAAKSEYCGSHNCADDECAAG